MHTETSTNFNQNVFPMRSFAKTTAPCNPVYVHFEVFGYAMYSLTIAAARILFCAFGTTRRIIAFSSAVTPSGILVAGGKQSESNSTEGVSSRN